jgi:hypothetical protein
MSQKATHGIGQQLTDKTVSQMPSVASPHFFNMRPFG